MIDLQGALSLPLKFDPAKNVFVYPDHIKCRKSETVRLINLIPTLLNKSLRYPENVYHENIDLFCSNDAEVFDSEQIHHELIVLPSGLLGIEYIKSHVYYSPFEKGKSSSMVECIYGILTIIIQKNKPKDALDFDTSVEEGMIVKLRKGEKIKIPSGYYYTFVNSRNTPVIFSRIYKNKSVADYTMLGREQGLAYFAIRKNARAEIVYNPKYREVKKLEKHTAKSEKFALEDQRKSLYQAAKATPNFFLDHLLGA